MDINLNYYMGCYEQDKYTGLNIILLHDADFQPWQPLIIIWLTTDNPDL